VEHVLFIEERAEYLGHDVMLMVVMLRGLGQLRCDVEFLIMIESQAWFVRDLQLLREKKLYGKHLVGLHTRDAARALPSTYNLDVPLSCGVSQQARSRQLGSLENGRGSYRYAPE
jgi:hypothetical protein